jgi:hypothetical protein
MRTLLFPFFFLSLFSLFPARGQVISGKVVNSRTGVPLEYVNIGIIDEPAGTITGKQGNFKLNIGNVPEDKTIKFSMIGFEPEIFSVKELLLRENKIELSEKTFELKEVIVNPAGKIHKLGTTGCSMRSICGWGWEWGGVRYTGYEIGLKIALGQQSVAVKKIHAYLLIQSFDSTLFRVHIREFSDGLPGKELLRENIYITVTRNSGWEEFDLSRYNIVLSGDIVLTLEWVDAFGINESRFQKMNRSKQPQPVVLFRCKKKKENIQYSKWGSEAKWNKLPGSSPSFYLTVR